MRTNLFGSDYNDSLALRNTMANASLQRAQFNSHPRVIRVERNLSRFTRICASHPSESCVASSFASDADVVPADTSTTNVTHYNSFGVLRVDAPARDNTCICARNAFRLCVSTTMPGRSDTLMIFMWMWVLGVRVDVWFLVRMWVFVQGLAWNINDAQLMGNVAHGAIAGAAYPDSAP